MYLAVKTPGTQERRVQHVGTVGSSQRDDAAIGAKAVHLRQQGVQRILTLVIATHGGILRTGTAPGINLIDKDNAWSFLLGFFKKVTHARGTHTHEHFYKVGTRHREEGHTSLTGHSLRKQCLTRSRRTYQEGTLGNLTAQVGIFLRILQEVHNLLHLLLRSCLSGHILEGDAQVTTLLVHLSLRLAHAEDAASA